MDKKNEKKQVVVNIDNKPYTLITNEDEEYILGVSRYINNKIQEISNSTKNVSKLKNSFYIWLCLNIADDLFKHRQLSLKNKNVFQEDIEKVNLDNSGLKEELENLQSKVQNLDEKLKSSENEEKILREQLERSENEVRALKEKIKVLEDNENSKSFEETEKLNSIIKLLNDENSILKKSFDKFSEQLNLKVVESSTDELNEVVNLHNRMVVSIAKKIEKLKEI